MGTRAVNKAVQEKALLDRLRQGDRSAMRELYEANAGYLFTVCSRYLPDDDQVKDVLQDAFIKIFRSIDRFNYRGEGSLRAWMTRIVVNDSLMALRRRKTVPLSGILSEPDVEETEDDPGIGEVPFEELLRMIRGLPDGYRKVFNLYVFEDKSHQEIGKLLGISESTSCSQFFRARASLARQINEYKKRNAI